MKGKKKKKLSPEESKQKQIQLNHAKLVKTAFRNSGFQTVKAISDKEFNYQGVTSDFDDVFIFENIVVFGEYTITKESEISTHLKKKKILYDDIMHNPKDFVVFFRDKFQEFAKALGDKFQPHQYRVVIIYCSLNAVKTETKQQVPCVFYYDYNVAKYFDLVAKTARRSARFEIFDFLGLQSKDIGDGVISSKTSQADTYQGSILPETHSNFGEDFKVVSFYIDPAALLMRAYVLRKDGWREGEAVYQRMISRAKIAAVRKYLRDEKRVFINNIIATLPEDTKIIDEKLNTIDPKRILDTQAGSIQLPIRFNSIGIVDGQHRVFSYHEGGVFEEEISKLRTQQNLLVTGIVFPKLMPDEERLKFEANLFLEINSNQTNAKSQLKQEINIMINPFAAESIAKRVVSHLNDSNGPLQDAFERFFFEKDKIKTTSVVSFAVRPLVNPSGPRSLFAIWNHSNKASLLSGNNHDVLAAYVVFCASKISDLFAAVRASLPNELWTADRKTAKHFLTTTNVNGLIACLRRIAAAVKLSKFDVYRKKLAKISAFPFENYKSSQ